MLCILRHGSLTLTLLSSSSAWAAPEPPSTDLAVYRAQLHTELAKIQPGTPKSDSPPPFPTPIQVPYRYEWTSQGWWGSDRTVWVGALHGMDGMSMMHHYDDMLVVEFRGDVLVKRGPKGGLLAYSEGHLTGTFHPLEDGHCADGSCTPPRHDDFVEIRQVLVWQAADGTVSVAGKDGWTASPQTPLFEAVFDGLSPLGFHPHDCVRHSR